MLLEARLSVQAVAAYYLLIGISLSCTVLNSPLNTTGFLANDGSASGHPDVFMTSQFRDLVYVHSSLHHFNQPNHQAASFHGANWADRVVVADVELGGFFNL